MKYLKLSLVFLINILVFESHALVGETPFTVDVNRGNASISIPINNIDVQIKELPSLAITSSERWSGATLGAGFYLSGISTIHRCAKNSEYYETTSAKNLKDDTFCVDGIRLIKQGELYTKRISDGVYYKKSGNDSDTANPREVGSC